MPPAIRSNPARSRVRWLSRRRDYIVPNGCTKILVNKVELPLSVRVSLHVSDAAVDRLNSLGNSLSCLYFLGDLNQKIPHYGQPPRIFL